MTDQYVSTQSNGWADGLDISSALKAKTKSINQSVSGFTNQTVNPIKSTLSDVKSGIALIKDTDRQFLNQLHSYRSAAIENINDYLGSLTGGRFSLSDFGKVISIKDGFKINKDELSRMAGNAIGFNLSSVDAIKSDLSNQFLNELNSMTLGLSEGLVQINGDKVTIANDWDKQIGDAVFGFLTNGNDDFRTIRNFAAANAVLNVMVNQNAEIGFVEGYSGFKDMYLYSSDYYSALINAVEILLRKGDINSLDEVLKILDTESIMSVKATYPEFAETVLTNFNLPDNALVEDYSTYGEKLITIIEKVNGTNWMYSKTFYGSCLNIGLVSYVSDSSKTVIECYTHVLSKQAESLSGTELTTLKTKISNLIVIINCSGFVNIEKSSDVFKRDFPDAVTF